MHRANFALPGANNLTPSFRTPAILTPSFRTPAILLPLLLRANFAQRANVGSPRTNIRAIGSP